MHRDASSESVAPWVNVPPAHRPSTDGSSTSGTDIAPNAGGYRPAIKLVKTKEDMHKFHKSAAHADLTGFVIALNAAVVGKRITEECTVSPAAEAMVDVLKTMEAWIAEIPPAQSQMRYGNTSFRVWHARMCSSAEDLLKRVLPAEHADAAVELATYLQDSFGNATRIDYGTGHETTFVALLLGLSKLGAFVEEDRQALVTRVFVAYIRLMRRLQTTYWLEPAGSHGMWGLDDYCFLPFYWGSAQLTAHETIRPSSIHKDELLQAYSEDYLYMDAVRFVRHVKKGPLTETSPMLSDISAIPTWAKVNQGMFKMYQAEVLGKFPIMQHFFFGSLLKLDPADPSAVSADTPPPEAAADASGTHGRHSMGPPPPRRPLERRLPVPGVGAAGAPHAARSMPGTAAPWAAGGGGGGGAGMAATAAPWAAGGGGAGGRAQAPTAAPWATGGGGGGGAAHVQTAAPWAAGGGAAAQAPTAAPWATTAAGGAAGGRGAPPPQHAPAAAAGESTGEHHAAAASSSGGE